MKNKILILLTALSLFISSCSDNVLDRPPLTVFTDATYWTSEDRLRLFANGFYNDVNNIGFFQGYSRSWALYYVPVRSLFVSDDFANSGTQTGFTNTSTGSTSYYIDGVWPGRGWYFTIVRKANLFLNRIENIAKPAITEESYNHWSGIARFFRAFEYTELVKTYGDVPWFGDEIKDTEKDIMFKDRDSRDIVMDNVYDDLKYAFENVRLNDGNAGTTVNRYVVAAYTSRIMLWEGTWQWYHKNNATLAKKFLDFAVEAAEFVMNSGNYEIQTDFHTLFGSDNLSNNKECILFRHYDAAASPSAVTHCIASYCNTQESQEGGANLSLLKSFICNDGKVWQNSNSFTDASISLASEGEKFRIENLIKTRDPRFEATFYYQYKSASPTLLYCNKFIDRIGTEGNNPGNVAKYSSMTNTNDAPVMRLGEVLLNYIEAKAVLAEHLGGAAVTQNDIDKSVNALRDRPIDAVAQSRGVKQTAHMLLSNLPHDPDRDADVPEIIWEIRRERRMELIYEASTRLFDLRRWKKLDYMQSGADFPDIMCSIWIDYTATDPADPAGILSSRMNEGSINIIGVRKLDGTVVKYNGTNASDLVGFNLTYNGQPRTQEPEEKHYLAPVPQSQRNFYTSQGYTLSNNLGW
ncbi:MAG: RagB/SusD family nutrient uptake outer membrane protein [Prevotellaceae bacterium]|jgi:hypothetical protein|nr:RagB/SusD family nutrient uptake outer membrane protein [Prevotellaceae bacterium]